MPGSFSRRTDRGRLGFLAGLAAGGAAGLVMLLARAAFAVPSIPELIQDQITLLLPVPLLAFFLDNLGYMAKPLFIAAAVAGQMLLAGAVGAAFGWFLATATPAPRVRWVALLALALGIWLLAVLIVLPILGAGLFGARSPVGGALAAGTLLVVSLAYGLTLGYLDEWATRPAEEAGGEPDPGRRALLRTLGWGTLAVAVGYFVLRGVSLLVSNATSTSRSRRPASRLPPEVTPNADFYVVSKNLANAGNDLTTWRLEVTGMVARPLTLTYDQLRALPAVEQYVTLECISNSVGGDLISNAFWKGVRLRDLLEFAEPNPGVRKVVVSASDLYDDSVTFAQAMSPATVLAYEMNGEQLPPDHGFPARLLVPGTYGIKNVKWVNRIELVDYDYKGYWQQRGWSDDAYVKTMSRIDVPRGQPVVDVGSVDVGGVAFGGDRGISRVEVSFDGGETWRDAVVKEALSPYTWVIWTLDWEAASGEHRVFVRATDRSDRLQEARQTATLPDGASGYHSIVVLVAPI